MATSTFGGDSTGTHSEFSPDIEHVKELQYLYERLVRDHPTHLGKELSIAEREAKALRASTLVYGEIRFEPYALAFQKVRVVSAKRDFHPST